MSTAYEKGKAITEAIGTLLFTPSTRNYTALVKFPYLCFAQYTPGDNNDYERGTVFRDGSSKLLMEYDGKFDISRCKLFRDGGEYDWVREEFCLFGFVRRSGGGRYRVKVPSVDSATPPENDPQSWEKLDE